MHQASTEVFISALFIFDKLGKGKLQNADLIIREESEESIMYIHRSPISTGTLWNDIKEKMRSK